MNMKKIIEWLKKWGLWILGILAVISGILRKVEEARIRRQLREASKESARASEAVGRAKEVLEASEEVVKSEEKKMAERKKKAAELAKRLDKLSIIIWVVIGTVLLAQSTVIAQDNSDALMKKYLEAVEIAKEYKALYEEAEKSNETLLAQVKLLQEQVKSLLSTVERLQKWIDELQSTILKMLGKKNLSLTGGVIGSPTYVPNLGGFLAVTVSF